MSMSISAVLAVFFARDAGLAQVIDDLGRTARPRPAEALVELPAQPGPVFVPQRRGRRFEWRTAGVERHRDLPPAGDQRLHRRVVDGCPVEQVPPELGEEAEP